MKAPAVLVIADSSPLIMPRQIPLGPKTASGRRLRLSPVSLLEIRFLMEVGRLRLVRGRGVAEITDDPRWQLDSPSSARLFTAALDVDWTRDPFDRLLVAHASYRRWRLATGDRFLIEQLREEDVLPL